MLGFIREVRFLVEYMYEISKYNVPSDPEGGAVGTFHIGTDL